MGGGVDVSSSDIRRGSIVVVARLGGPSVFP